MDSGNINVYDVELVLKQILAQQISVQRLASVEDSSDKHSQAKVIYKSLFFFAIEMTSFQDFRLVEKSQPDSIQSENVELKGR